jgi:hypothetical protein
VGLIPKKNIGNLNGGAIKSHFRKICMSLFMSVEFTSHRISYRGHEQVDIHVTYTALINVLEKKGETEMTKGRREIDVDEEERE